MIGVVTLNLRVLTPICAKILWMINTIIGVDTFKLKCSYTHTRAEYSIGLGVVTIKLNGEYTSMGPIKTIASGVFTLNLMGACTIKV